MLDQTLVSLFQTGVSFTGLMMVFVQLRRGTKQRETQSLIEIFNINRHLLTLGFSNPDLFTVLRDGDGVDPAREEHYLQLWSNQMWLIHTFLVQSALTGEIKESLLHSISHFAGHSNFRRYWRENCGFYPTSFRELVAAFIKERELSALQTAPEYSGEDG